MESKKKLGSKCYIKVKPKIPKIGRLVRKTSERNEHTKARVTIIVAKKGKEGKMV